MRLDTQIILQFKIDDEAQLRLLFYAIHQHLNSSTQMITYGLFNFIMRNNHNETSYSTQSLWPVKGCTDLSVDVTLTVTHGYQCRGGQT